MNTIQILGAILGSSVISTLLAAWFNFKLQNRNYKKEYYKKIIDKRIEAYEKVNKLTSMLSTYVQMEGFLVHAHFSTSSSLIRITNEVRNCIDYGLWLSNKTGSSLTELNTFIINEFDNQIDPSWSIKKGNTVCLNIAREKYKEIDRFKRFMKSQVSNDIKNLYKIDQFFDEREDTKGFPLYNRPHSIESDKEYFE